MIGDFIKKFIKRKTEKRKKDKDGSDKDIEEGICPSCGELIPIDSEECPECGEKLESSTPPSEPQKTQKKESKTYNDIKEEIDRLQDEEEMIDTRAIESALEDSNIERAESLLEELEDKYEEYKDTLDKLQALDKRKNSLANQLADKEIDRDTFNEAVESIKHQKHDLEEKLNKLRQEVIYEDYEKPF